MIPQINIQTSRLLLREILQGDAGDLFALRLNEEVNKYLDRKLVESVEEVKMLIMKLKADIASCKAFYWVIIDLESKVLIGTVCLFNFSKEMASGELGYELLPEFHGKGIMTEALKPIIDFGFRSVGLREIEAFTDQNNMPSIRLLERLGFNKTSKSDKTNPQFICYNLYLQ